ncbi:MAG: hypothetical protein HYX66_06635 [Ignavibacteria bacterium]|nr:hypothetical protein [Ignavibacteria bacterium]
MSGRIIAAAVSIVITSLYGCSQSPVTNSNDIVFPDSLVSYQKHVKPFLNLRCGQCHSDSYAAGGIRLTQYSYLLFDKPNLIVPGKPDESLVNQVLERIIAHQAGRMETIPSNQINGMRTWVTEGALNN